MVGTHVRTFIDTFRGELRRIRTDRGALLVLCGAVVIYAFFYPIPYTPEILRDVPIAVIDLDGTALSRRLVRFVDASELLRIAARPTTIREAEESIRAGRTCGALVVPEGFQRDVMRGARVTVGAYGDASYFLVYRQVLTGLVQTTGTLSAGIEIRRLRASGAMKEQARGAREPIALRLRSLYNPSGGYATYVVPAVLILILQQTLLIGIGMLGGTAREATGNPREPSRTIESFLGRACAYLALYTLHILFYMFIVYGVYRFPVRGRPMDVLLFLLPFVIAVILLGFAMSTLFRRRETAMQVLLFTSIPALFLSGFSFPFETIPQWLRTVAYVFPSTAGIRGFLRVNQMGADLHAVRHEWWILWGLCSVYFGLAWAVGRARPVRQDTALSFSSPPT